MRIDQLKEQDIETFFKAVMSLENIDECYDFFDDLMTLKEMKIFLMRFNVAQMLLDGKTYQEIEAETHASTAIISRVKRSCEEGNQSYQLLRERLVKQDRLIIEEARGFKH